MSAYEPAKPVPKPAPANLFPLREATVAAVMGDCVYVPLGAVCNNNCLFCVEDDREKRQRVNSAMRGDRVRELLAHHAEAGEICFTAGEPTLHPELPLFVRFARELGVPQVSVITNGRRLSYPGFAAQLVRAGLTRVYVSIHGHSARLHDQLTRTDGSFDQTVSGLRAAIALESRGLTTHSSTVLTTHNTPFLLELYEMLLALGVAETAFHALHLTGRAARLVDTIVPRYADVRAAFDRLLANAPDHGERAVLLDVPLCVTAGLPPWSTGQVGRLVHFETEPSLRGTCEAIPVAPGEGVGGTASAPGARVFGAPCETCSYRPECPGVATAYVRHFGWSEFGQARGPRVVGHEPGA